LRKARSLIRIGRTEFSPSEAVFVCAKGSIPTVVKLSCSVGKHSRLAHKDSAAIPAQTSKPHLSAPEAPATMSEGCRLIASAFAVLP